jgi:lyso-ornithine lipid O-acyltransferase
MASRSIARADPFAPVRAIARIAALAFLLLFSLVPHGLWRLFRVDSPWPRILLRAVTHVCGANVRTRGMPLKHDVFFVANHQSWLDIPILGGTTGTAFVAHEGIARWPLIGWLAALNRTVFVARADRLGVSNQIATLRAAIGAGQPVAIFPEGTTDGGGTLLPFKPALLAVMAPPPRPMMLQPVLIDYGPDRADIVWVGEEPAPDNAWRVLGRRGRFDVQVDFLEPFDPSSCGDRKAIAAEARRRMLAASAPGTGHV